LFQCLGYARVKRLSLLRKAFEEIAKVKQADQRHNIRPDRRARDHEIDYTKTDGIDDVDLLSELIVGEKLHVDAICESVAREAFDKIIVIDAAVGDFWLFGNEDDKRSVIGAARAARTMAGAAAMPTSKDRRLTR
jgi:hypothetical protein